MNQETPRHAIVIGASMGGLLAARVLADYYEQVTLLERDTFPIPGENRPGAPQGRHAHALLLKGREAIAQFFPGIIEELLAQGALESRVEDTRFFINGGYFTKVDNELSGLLVSRPLLEAQVRQRLLALRLRSGQALPNVKAIENCQVLDLVTNSDAPKGSRPRITGVKFSQCNGSNTEEILTADLVVDATGRNSQTPKWLANLGYKQPEIEQVEIDVTYTTRIYRRSPEQLQGNTAMVVSASPPSWRGGVILAQEESRWIVSVGGYMNDRPKMEDPGFMEFVKSLPAPDIYHAIKDAEPLSDYVPYKFPSSLRRRYEKLRRFPDGYLVFGDGICSFNPIYGQGMTVAALEAIALQNCLQQGTNNLAHRFFKAASKVIDVPWNITVGSDLRIPQVKGKRSLMGNLLNWYISKLQAAAHQDPVLAIAFLEVTNLMVPPGSLMRPGIVFRVLLNNLWHQHQLPRNSEQLSVNSYQLPVE